MTFEDMANEINQVFEQMYFDTSRKPYRVPITPENQEFVNELKAACEFQPWCAWTVMGVVGGKKHFILHNRMQPEFGFAAPVADVNAGELIVVDFKAKKVLSRQAA